MAIPGFAENFLIPAGSNDPEIIPIGVILHVDAGNASSLYEFFRDRSGGIESHGHIRLDGSLQWFRDSTREADANFKANSFIGKDGRRYGFISIETQGYGDGVWTDAQLATIKRVLEWAHETHDIPLIVCDGPFSPGIGYHTLFPWIWTPVAKSCPGPRRIVQFKDVLVPWMVVARRPKPVGKSTADHVQAARPQLRAALKELTKGARKGNRPAVRRSAAKVKAAIKILNAR